MGSGVSCVGEHDGAAGAARVRQRPGRELGPQGVTPARPQGVTPAHQPARPPARAGTW